MQKEAFEPTGLIPRSIIRTFDRFVQQLLPGTERIAIQEYRVSRYQILVSIKSLFTLICIPLLVNYTVKYFLLTPLTEHFWNSSQGEIFLNEYQEKRAFAEMRDFSDKIFFESLLLPESVPVANGTSLHKLKSSAEFKDEQSYNKIELNQSFDKTKPSSVKVNALTNENFVVPCLYKNVGFVTGEAPYRNPVPTSDQTRLQNEVLQCNKEILNLQTQFQIKSIEIANTYNKQSILAITSLLGDLVTFFTVYLLFILMKPQIIILKSFLTESIYSLSDTTKSFLLILGMDLLVGFHSPRGWEIVLENVLRHFGLPENENFILLFVALFPVFLDTVFKYWIFRYLNKISPSTVVTYHSMLE